MASEQVCKHVPEYLRGNTYCSVCKVWLWAGPIPRGTAEPSTPAAEPQTCSECGRSNTFITMASTAVGNCGKCGMPIIAAGPAQPLSCDKCETPICEHTASVVATLQAERDRLREWHLEETVKRAAAQDAQEAAESQLAEARKAAKGWLQAAASNRESIGEKDYGAHVDPKERIAVVQEFCAGELLAALSQPINPPAVPSEEE